MHRSDVMEQFGLSVNQAPANLNSYYVRRALLYHSMKRPRLDADLGVSKPQDQQTILLAWEFVLENFG